ncbi:hypothetical protein JRO89_XS11G0061700 [Xanthoceras sorbifolium]|uniref:Retrovirus-related Pol polyprotein from transposon TNT 1-94-like beta-barrel domain-containing protein n=1 Tax=Xanthoceras sorbifolium TaxID=99658 RepID=A0ABQ8HEU6_9ROSI|nr:hypothetical protein JRO89_XS11G0061700 [Xanthoceras sorbifolium]
MLMENFFRSKEYWQVVDFGVAKPAFGTQMTETQKTELEALKLKDLKAKNYLFQAIDQFILETILSKETSKQIWDSIKQKFRRSAMAKRQHLQALRTEFEVHDSQRKGRGRGNHHSTTYRPRSDKSNVECHRCHRYDHYKFECRTNLNKEHGEKSNFVANQEEEIVSPLIACHAKKEVNQNMWYLDTGCNNHMCEDKFAFSELDESFRNTVKFGDNYLVSVMGKGNVTIRTKENTAQIISNIFFVSDLKTNLLSIGQLQEKGYEIIIREGVFSIQDPKKGLIAQVNITSNRMFPLYLHNTVNLCFSDFDGDNEDEKQQPVANEQQSIPNGTQEEKRSQRARRRLV